MKRTSSALSLSLLSSPELISKLISSVSPNSAEWTILTNSLALISATYGPGLSTLSSNKTISSLAGMSTSSGNTSKPTSSILASGTKTTFSGGPTSTKIEE